MKRKEIYLNLSLILLIALMIVQASLLWIKLPELKQKTIVQEQYNTEDIFKNLLKPKKLIVNFGANNHTVLYDFPEIWNEYVDVISSIFMQISDSNLSLISPQEYMDLQKEKSIVFSFTKEMTANLFLNLIGKSTHSEPKTNIVIREIYISNDNIVISNSKGIYKLKINLGKDPTSKIEDLAKFSTRKYENFYEKYNIAKNIYIPINNKMTYREISYKDEIIDMEKQYKNNLASRVLNQNIDYIREITQADGTTYVYEDRFLKLLSSGIINYENPENFQIKENNLFLSLKTAMSFISSKMGISSYIRLNQIEPIKEKDNLGYKFTFNFTEDSIPVYLISNKLFDYIEIEVYSDHVKSYRQVYRSSIKEPEETYKEITETTIEEIIKNNFNKFVENYNGIDEIELIDIIQNIDDIDLVYIDSDLNNNISQLEISVCISYKNRDLFFSLDDGKFIMER